MTNIKWGCFITACTISTTIYAQAEFQSSSPLLNLEKGISLFEDAQYNIAQEFFDTYIQEHSTEHNTLSYQKAAYYGAVSAMKQGHENAEALADLFLVEHINSPEIPMLQKAYADYYFEGGNFKKAIHWYEKMADNILEEGTTLQYYFNLGYAYYIENQLDNAIEFLKPVAEETNSLEEDATYYLGFIHYKKKEWDTALSYFKQLESSKKYNYQCSNYVAQILYFNGRFDESIQYIEKRIKHSTKIELRNLLAVKAMSLVQIKNFDKAISTYMEYESLGGRLQNEDFYNYGFAKMQKKDFKEAIRLFKKVASKNKALTQNTQHHLGTSLLAVNYKEDAILAFQRSVELDVDPEVTEESHFNYAKLAYEQGDVFGNSQNALQSFIDRYPNSPYINDVYGYLVNNYLNKKEYSKAISSLEITGLTDLKLRKAYQKICYFRAIQLFNDTKYWSCLDHLNKSLTQHIDRRISSQAKFWKGETFYRLKKYKKAIANYQAFFNDPNSKNITEYKNAYYNLGYAYLQNKEYGPAANKFDQYVNKAKDTKSVDAIIRSADSFFMQQNYKQAKTRYRSATENNSIESDYASFQEAICVSLLGDHQTKVDILKNFKETYPSSSYNDEALLELGNAYFQLRQHENAIFSYERLLNSFPSSIHVNNAELKIGLVYMNTNSNDKALTVFKDIIDKYKANTISREALRNIKNIYVESGEVNKYALYISNIPFANESVASLDSTSYESGELQYLKGDFEQAEISLENYISNYPEGYFIVQANFYLGEVYLKNNKKDKAVIAFSEVVKDQHNAFQDESNLNLAELEFSSGNYTKAAEYYSKLQIEAQYPKYKETANVGIMRCQFELEQYGPAMESAKKVIQSTSSGEDIIVEGNYILAKSAFMHNSLKLARSKFSWLKENVEGEKLAEAYYYSARILFMQNEYENSKKEVYEQAKVTPGYKTWLAKSLILLAQNLHALEDNQNAIYTLEQVVKNYTEEDIVEEAEMLKESYEISLQKETIEQ